MILTLITFFLILSVLVFVHEFGHFMMAKKIGVKVEEFGFGLPPRIWGIKKGETLYSINWLPIGGFVKLAGEDEQEPLAISGQLSDKEKKRFFFARNKKERAAILLAGVTMNFILAVIIVSYIFTQGVLTPTDRVHVYKVAADSPASQAGILENDTIIKFDNQTIKNTSDLINITQKRAGEVSNVLVNRGGQELILLLTPRKDPPAGQGPLGVEISNLEEKKYPWYQAPFYGLLETLNMTYLMLVSLGALLFKLITFQPVGAEVAGPIGIAQATGQAVNYGIMAVLQLAGLLSLNLAIINVLPIPALDGGRLMFVILEKFIGKRIKPRAERVAHQIGMAFLLALIVLVTVNDVLRLIRK